MIKFYKIRNTKLWKAVEVNEKGQRGNIKAIIGTVSKLLEKKLILKDNIECNTEGNEEKWIVIYTTVDRPVVFQEDLAVVGCDSLQEAKEFCKSKWTE